MLVCFGNMAKATLLVCDGTEVGAQVCSQDRIGTLRGREEPGRVWQERPGGRRAEGIQVEVTAGAEAKRSGLPAEEWQEMCRERKYWQGGRALCATLSGS